MTAQVQTINSQLKLTNLPVGVASDSVLVAGSSNIVKRVKKSDFLAGVPTDANLVHKTGDETIPGNKNFTGETRVSTGSTSSVNFAADASTVVGPDYSSPSLISRSIYLKPWQFIWGDVFGANVGQLKFASYNSTLEMPQYEARFKAWDLSANREYTLPNLSGTVALSEYTVGDFINNSATTIAPSQNAVFDALALKANDSGVLHTTGNETKTGILTFTNTTNPVTNGISLSNSVSGLNGALTVANTGAGYGIALTNSSTGRGINISNSNTGRGIEIGNASSGSSLYTSNDSTGKGIEVNNNGAGQGVSVNGGGLSTGKLFSGKNSGTETFSVAKDGTITGGTLSTGNSSGQFQVNHNADNFSTFNFSTTDIGIDNFGTVNITADPETGINIGRLQGDYYQGHTFGADQQIIISSDATYSNEVQFSPSFTNFSQRIKVPQLDLYDGPNADYGNLQITDNQFFANSYLGYNIFGLSNNSGFNVFFNADGITGNRSYTMPNADGTFALLENTPNFTNGIALYDPSNDGPAVLAVDDSEFTIYNAFDNEQMFTVSSNTGNNAVLSFNNLTADRGYNFPDAGGTVALTNAVVNLTGNQGISGIKQFVHTPKFDSGIELYDVSQTAYASIYSADNVVTVKNPAGNSVLDMMDGNLRINYPSGPASVLLGIQDLTTNRNLDFVDANGRIPVLRSSAPSSSTAAGIKGEVYMDSTGFYYCYDTNLWRKCTGNTF